MSSSTNVQVALRLRASNVSGAEEEEEPLQRKDFLEVIAQVLDPTSVSLKDPRLTRKAASSSAEDKHFTFDRVFPSDSSQQEVYSIVKPLVDHALEGYNIAILAYGQTASGKTFTMTGRSNPIEESPSDSASDLPEENTTDDETALGVIPRVSKQIQGHVLSHPKIDFTVTASYLEIYQEKLRDLLVPAPAKVLGAMALSNGGATSDTLKIRLDPLSISGKDLYVDGLSSRILKTLEDYTSLLETGRRNRSVGETKMNKESSRSHAVFTLTIEQSEKVGVGTSSNQEEGEGVSARKRCKIHLVDLAGSERQDSTRAQGVRLKEASSINSSLSCLGNVINALSSNAPFIPYRDSKLTYLLSDSLGGNSMTLMMACITPTAKEYDETLGTLKFAERAKKVANSPRINLDATSLKILELQAEIRRLHARLAKCTCGGALKDENSLSESSGRGFWSNLFCCGSSKEIERGVVHPVPAELEPEFNTLKPKRRGSSVFTGKEALFPSRESVLSIISIPRASTNSQNGGTIYNNKNSASLPPLPLSKSKDPPQIKQKSMISKSNQVDSTNRMSKPKPRINNI